MSIVPHRDIDDKADSILGELKLLDLGSGHISAMRLMPAPDQLVRTARDLVSFAVTHCLRRGSRDAIAVTDAIRIVDAESVQLASQPAVLTLSGAMCIVGDLHGDIESLLRIFSRHGWPPESRYLFLGDYVDRGKNSTLVILVLYSLHLLHPEHVFLLRGNHESRSLTTVGGFKKECHDCMSSEFYERVMASFNILPIAAVLNDETFCVHDGFSPTFQSRADILAISKPVGDLTEFLERDLPGHRGCGFIFGAGATEAFL
jgi:hypothetical protein